MPSRARRASCIEGEKSLDIPPGPAGGTTWPTTCRSSICTESIRGSASIAPRRFPSVPDASIGQHRAFHIAKSAIGLWKKSLFIRAGQEGLYTFAVGVISLARKTLCWEISQPPSFPTGRMQKVLTHNPHLLCSSYDLIGRKGQEFVPAYVKYGKSWREDQ
jgi:hypothetical protein